MTEILFQGIYVKEVAKDVCKGFSHKDINHIIVFKRVNRKLLTCTITAQFNTLFYSQVVKCHSVIIGDVDRY